MPLRGTAHAASQATEGLPDEQASYGGADLLLPGGLLLRLDAHKVAVERLGIVLRYRGPYIHVGDRLTNQLYSTNPDACDKRTLCM